MAEKEVTIPPFTLVSTVFNEISRLDQTIADLNAQTLLPQEIVVVDAGSRDGTYERLLRWQAESRVPVVVVQQPRCNVAQGRNLAIAHARHALIASTDFGCRFHPDWLASLMAPFRDPAVAVVGGAFAVREEYITTLAAKADYVLSNGYVTAPGTQVLASSRSIAYYKRVWHEIGGYPEWLTLAGDDLVFWHLIQKKEYNLTFSSQPRVYWLRHGTFGAFGREATRYGRGDGESGINLRNFWSNLIETGLRYSLGLTVLTVATVGLLGNFSAWWLLPLPAQLLGLRSYRNAGRNWQRLRHDQYPAGVLLASFWLIEVTRIGYLRGYLLGWFGRTGPQRAQAARLRTLLA